MPSKSVADIEGPWNDPDWDSGLVARCKQYWSVPANELPDLAVATYLEQCIATQLMMEEARRRIALGRPDDSEFFDGQLCEALRRAIAASGERQR